METCIKNEMNKHGTMKKHRKIDKHRKMNKKAGYDFKRLVYGTLLFTATMYVLLFSTAYLGQNYDKNLSELGGGIFNEEKWILGTETKYQEIEDLRNASRSADTVDLDKPTSVKSIYEKVSDVVLTPFYLVFSIMASVFNVPPAVMWILGIILSVEIMLMLWALFKKGD